MNRVKKATTTRRRNRQKVRSGSHGNQLLLAVVRSFAAGIGTAVAILCLLSVVSANTALPLG